MRIYLDGAADVNTRAKTTDIMTGAFEGAMWIGQGDQPEFGGGGGMALEAASVTFGAGYEF